jgi:hypothetical protein
MIMKKSIHAALIASTALVSVAPAFAAPINLLENSVDIVIDITGEASASMLSSCTRSGGGLSDSSATTAGGIIASEAVVGGGAADATYNYASVDDAGHLTYALDQVGAPADQVYRIVVGLEGPVVLSIKYRAGHAAPADTAVEFPFDESLGLAGADSRIVTVEDAEWSHVTYTFSTPGTKVVTLKQKENIVVTGADGIAAPTGLASTLLQSQTVARCGQPVTADPANYDPTTFDPTADTSTSYSSVIETEQHANAAADALVCRFKSATAGTMAYDEATNTWSVDDQPLISLFSVGATITIDTDNDLYDASNPSDLVVAASGDWDYAADMKVARAVTADSLVVASDNAAISLSTDKDIWTYVPAYYGEQIVNINGSIVMESAELLSQHDYATRHTITCAQ